MTDKNCCDKCFGWRDNLVGCTCYNGDCSCHQPKSQESWIEEFEKILDKGWTGYGDMPNVKNLKSFITDLLEKERKNARREVQEEFYKALLDEKE